MGSKTLALAASSAWSFAFAPAAQSAPGDLDHTFGTDGFLWIDTSGEVDRARGVAIQDDGKILIGRDNERDLSVMRLESDGSLDSGFGAAGVASLSVVGQILATAAVIAQSDGKVIAVGTIEDDFAVARFLSDGRVDTSFGAGGLARARVTDAALASAVTQQGDGKLVIGGGTTTVTALVRFDTAGLLDASFGAGGTAFFSASGSGRVTALTQQPDGKLIAAATTLPSAIAVLRFARDGVLDPSFGGGGLALVAAPARYGLATAVAVQGDGKIVVGGYGCSDEQCRFPEHAVVARLDADGSLDGGFGSGGRVSIETAFSNLIVNGSLAIEPNGSMLVGGERWSGDPWWSGWYPPFDGFLARITPSGALDPGFGHAGIAVVDGGDGTHASSVAMQGIVRLPDGSLVAAMTSQPEADAARIAVVRAAAAGDHPGRLGFMFEPKTYQSEGQPALFAVRRTGGSAGAVSVDYSTVSVLAQSGTDFTATTGTLTWADGNADTQEISIPISQDSVVEPDEQFTLQLSNPAGGASLAATVGTVTILGVPRGNPAPLPAPPSTVSRSGGGAGGALDALLLGLALLASRARGRVRG
jgi:uncharacterized delta-60 repeat protein